MCQKTSLVLVAMVTTVVLTACAKRESSASTAVPTYMPVPTFTITPNGSKVTDTTGESDTPPKAQVQPTETPIPATPVVKTILAIINDVVVRGDPGTICPTDDLETYLQCVYRDTYDREELVNTLSSCIDHPNQWLPIVDQAASNGMDLVKPLFLLADPPNPNPTDQDIYSLSAALLLLRVHANGLIIDGPANCSEFILTINMQELVDSFRNLIRERGSK